MHTSRIGSCCFATRKGAECELCSHLFIAQNTKIWYSWVYDYTYVYTLNGKGLKYHGKNKKDFESNFY